MKKLRWLCLVAILISFSLNAQNKFEFWPGTGYDPAIPTYAKVFGHEPGERILSPADLLKYLDALAAASPRLRIVRLWQELGGQAAGLRRRGKRIKHQAPG